MEPSRPVNEPAYNDLVAYLDGELDPEVRRRLEQRLKTDRLTRNEFRRLRRVWQCLDQLPLATVDTSFSRSTVEMAVVAAEEEIEHARAAAPAVRRKRGLTAMGACLTTGLASFLIAAALWPDPDRQLIRDLPLIENFDAYLQIDDIQFLRDLDREALFAKETNNQTDRADRAGCRHRIESMTPLEKADLALRQQQFLALPAQQQDHVRQIHAELENAPDRDRLRGVLQRYHAWLKRLSPGQRAQLHRLGPADRIRRVRQYVETLQRQATWQLSPADTQAVTSWLHDLVATNPRIRHLLAGNQHNVLENLTTWEREQLRYVNPRRRRIAMTLYALQQARTGKAPALLSEDDLNRLRERLSPRARKTLDEATSPGERRRVIVEWVRQAVRGPVGPRELHRVRQEIPRETLERFFADDLTDNDLREELLNLPSGEMEQRLRELYRRQAMATSPGPGRRPRTRRDGPRPPKSHTRPPPPRENAG